MNPLDILNIAITHVMQEYALIAFFLFLSMAVTTLWALRVASSEWQAREAIHQRYDALLEQVAVAVVTVPVGGGKLLDANRYAGDISGYSFEEMQKLTSDYLFPTGETDWVAEASKLGKAVFPNVTMRRSSGETMTVHANAVVVQDEGCKALQIVISPAQSLPLNHAYPLPMPMGRREKPATPPIKPTPEPTMAASYYAPTTPTTRPALPTPKPPDAPARANVTVEQVIRTVAEHFGVSAEDLKQTKVTPRLTLARRVAMYLATHVAAASPEEVGQTMNGRSPMAVAYNARLVADLLDQDPNIRQRVESLRAQLLVNTIAR